MGPVSCYYFIAGAGAAPNNKWLYIHRVTVASFHEMSMHVQKNLDSDDVAFVAVESSVLRSFANKTFDALLSERLRRSSTSLTCLASICGTREHRRTAH